MHFGTKKGLFTPLIETDHSFNSHVGDRMLYYTVQLSKQSTPESKGQTAPPLKRYRERLKMVADSSGEALPALTATA